MEKQAMGIIPERDEVEVLRVEVPDALFRVHDHPIDRHHILPVHPDECVNDEAFSEALSLESSVNAHPSEQGDRDWIARQLSGEPLRHRAEVCGSGGECVEADNEIGIPIPEHPRIRDSALRVHECVAAKVRSDLVIRATKSRSIVLFTERLEDVSIIRHAHARR